MINASLNRDPRECILKRTRQTCLEIDQRQVLSKLSNVQFNFHLHCLRSKTARVNEDSRASKVLVIVLILGVFTSEA